MRSGGRIFMVKICVEVMCIVFLIFLLNLVLIFLN